MMTDTVTSDLTTSALGLAVLAGITLTLFALWAEYFKAYLKQETEAGAKLEIAQERFRVRIASLMVVIFQLTLFLSAEPVRKLYPVQSTLLFVVAFMIQSLIQTSIEKQFLAHGAKAETPPEVVKNASRGLFWFLTAGLVYTTFVLSSLGVASAIVYFFKTTLVVSNLLVMGSGIFGIGGGIALNFVLGTLWMSKMFSATPLERTPTEKIATECLQGAGMKAKTPRLFQIETSGGKAGTVVVTGFPSGRGIFKPAIFFSKKTLETLDANELKAVIMHELGHISMKHLNKRWMLSSALLLVMIFACSFLTVLAHYFIQDDAVRSLVGPVVAIAAFVLGTRVMALQSRYHEVQADIFAVKNLRGDIENLASALRKLDQLNGNTQPRAATIFSTHPSTEVRIKVLRKYFSSKVVSVRAANQPEETNDQNKAA